MSEGEESKQRRGSFILSNRSMIRQEGAEGIRFLNSIRASIGNDLTGESEACLSYRLAIVRSIIEY